MMQKISIVELLEQAALVEDELRADNTRLTAELEAAQARIAELEKVLENVERDVHAIQAAYDRLVEERLAR